MPLKICDLKIESLTLKDNDEMQGILKRIYKEKDFTLANFYLYYNLTTAFFKNQFSGYDKKSFKVTYKNKMIGFLVLIDFSINFELVNEDAVKKYIDKNGLKSVMLYVDKKHQRKGVGTMMLDYVEHKYKNKFDYLWGIQHREISNTDFFLKRRNFIFESKENGEIYTIKEFKNI